MKKMRSKFTKALPPRPDESEQSPIQAEVRPLQGDKSETQNRRSTPPINPVSSTTSLLLPSFASLDEVKRLRKELDLANQLTRRNQEIGTKFKQDLVACRSELASLQSDFIAMRALLPSNADLSETFRLVRSLKLEIQSLKQDIHEIKEPLPAESVKETPKVDTSPIDNQDLTTTAVPVEAAHKQTSTPALWSMPIELCAESPVAAIFKSNALNGQKDTPVDSTPEDAVITRGRSLRIKNETNGAMHTLPAKFGPSRANSSLGSGDSPVILETAQPPPSQDPVKSEENVPASLPRGDLKLFLSSQSLSNASTINLPLSAKREAFRLPPKTALSSLDELGLPPLPPLPISQASPGPAKATPSRSDKFPWPAGAKVAESRRSAISTHSTRRRSKTFSGYIQQPLLSKSNGNFNRSVPEVPILTEPILLGPSASSGPMSSSRKTSTRGSQAEPRQEPKVVTKGFSPEPVFSTPPLNLHVPKLRRRSTTPVPGFRKPIESPADDVSPVSLASLMGDDRSWTDLLAQPVQAFAGGASSGHSPDADTETLVSNETNVMVDDLSTTMSQEAEIVDHASGAAVAEQGDILSQTLEDATPSSPHMLTRVPSDPFKEEAGLAEMNKQERAPAANFELPSMNFRSDSNLSSEDLLKLTFKFDSMF